MIQTWAIFKESYLHLNSKKLFWVSLIISGLIVLTFGAIGIDEDGMSFLFWDLPFPLNSSWLAPGFFYKFAFAQFGVRLWLTWGATILALVCTAGIIPEFLSGGSIDVTLSKPISRLRLFLTKYAAAMLFVALQVGVFAGASFLVIGLRGGTWEPAILLSIPLVVIFFSYIYAVCVLLGVLTRSTVAALLLTLLIWMGFFAVHLTESALLMFRTQTEQQVQWLREDVASREATLESARAEPKEGIVNTLRSGFNVNSKEAELTRRREQLADKEESLRAVVAWHTGVVAAKTALPKTSETIGLLERRLIDMADLSGFADDEGGVQMQFDDEDDDLPVPRDDAAVSRAIVEKSRARSVWWIIGTSLIFEAVVVGLAARIFCRRDF